MGGAAAVPGKQDWESICSRCGLCCYLRRLTPAGLHVDTHAPCRFLDEQTRLCTVYQQRFRVCADCRKVTLFHALFSPYLPDSCGYVQAYRKYPSLEKALTAALRWVFGTEGARLRRPRA